jgi:hypothetical protein
MPQPLYPFHGDTFKDLDKCPWCGASRCKNNDLYNGDKASTGNKRNKKGGKKAVQESQPPEDTPLGNDVKQRRISALIMWYLLVTDRLRHIFLNPKEAAHMTWWDDERKVDDDKIAHPADCSQWQNFDEKYKDFSEDQRNVRFSLSTDGMNPFNERMIDHST